MIQSQSLIFGFVIIFGFIILWLIYANQKIEQKTDLFKNETPLISVDGKIPPKLSNFPAHLRYIDDATCLQCHATERKMNFGNTPLIAKKMPHEYRGNCVSCHLLEK